MWTFPVFQTLVLLSPRWSKQFLNHLENNNKAIHELVSVTVENVL